MMLTTGVLATGAGPAPAGRGRCGIVGRRGAGAPGVLAAVGMGGSAMFDESNSSSAGCCGTCGKAGIIEGSNSPSSLGACGSDGIALASKSASSSSSYASAGGGIGNGGGAPAA